MLLHTDSEWLSFMQHVDAVEVLEDATDGSHLVFAPDHLAVIIRQLQPVFGILVQVVAVAGVAVVFEDVQPVEGKGCRVQIGQKQIRQFVAVRDTSYATAVGDKGGSAILTDALYKRHLLQLAPDRLAFTLWRIHIIKPFCIEP